MTNKVDSPAGAGSPEVSAIATPARPQLVHVDARVLEGLRELRDATTYTPRCPFGSTNVRASEGGDE